MSGINGGEKFVDYQVGPMRIESVTSQPVDLRMAFAAEGVAWRAEAWKMNLLAACQHSDVACFGNGNELVLLRLPTTGRVYTPTSKEKAALDVSILARFPVGSSINGVYRSGEGFAATTEDGSLHMLQPTPDGTFVHTHCKAASNSCWGFDSTLVGESLDDSKILDDDDADNRWVAVSNNDRTVELGIDHCSSREEIRWTRSIDGHHRHNIPGVAFSPSGDFVVTCSIDGHLRLFSTRQSGMLEFFVMPDWGWAVGFIDSASVHVQLPDEQVDYGNPRVEFARDRQPPLDLERISTLPPSRVMADMPPLVSPDISPTVWQLPLMVLRPHELSIDEDYADAIFNPAINNDEEDEEQHDGEYDMMIADEGGPDEYIRIPPSGESLEDDESEGPPTDRSLLDGDDDDDHGLGEEGGEELVHGQGALACNDQDARQLVFLLTSKDLLIYRMGDLCRGTSYRDRLMTLAEAHEPPRPVLSLHRLLYGSVSPDQRAFFNNAALEWAHERYSLCRWYAPLSCLFLGNQLGFVTIVHIRYPPTAETSKLDQDLRSVLLTVPMGDADVKPLVGLEARCLDCPSDPSKGRYHHLYMLHLDGSMRVFLIRRLKK